MLRVKGLGNSPSFSDTLCREHRQLMQTTPVWKKLKKKLSELKKQRGSARIGVAEKRRHGKLEE